MPFVRHTEALATSLFLVSEDGFSRGRFRPPSLIVSINAYFFASPQDAVEENAVSLVAYRTRPVIRSLRRYGAQVLQWDPGRESFGAVLLRQVRLP